jgi:hypothetical protein
VAREGFRAISFLRDFLKGLFLVFQGISRAGEFFCKNLEKLRNHLSGCPLLGHHRLILPPRAGPSKGFRKEPFFLT